MQSLRESNYFKVLIIFMAFAIFNFSCTNSSLNNLECSNTVNLSTSNANLASNFEHMLEIMKAIQNVEGFNSHDDFHNYVFQNSDNSQQYLNMFKSENLIYKQLGFNEYIASKNEVSTNLKNYLTTYGIELLDFIHTSHPNLSEMTSFLDNKILSVLSTEFCEKDQAFLRMYFDLSKGYANYYYKMFYSERNNIELRDCNFWESLGCGLLALTVGVIITSVVSLVVLIKITGIIINGNEDELPKDTLLITTLGLLALGIVVGVSVYEWCCGKDEVPEQNCKAPTGSFYTSLGCNDYRVTLFGPSSYGTTQWSNTNTNPGTTTTQTPSLRFSVPNLGSPSIINAPIVACLSSGTSVELFSYGPENQTFIYNSPTPTIIWGQSPPSTATVNTTYNVSVSTAGNGIVSWSVSPFGGMVMSTGTSSGNLIFWTSGQKTVTATITDNCTGQNASVSKQVFVQ